MIQRCPVGITTIMVAICLVLYAAGCKEATKPLLSSHAIQEVVKEVTSVQPNFRQLTPDRAGKRLAFMHAVENGRRLVIYDLLNNSQAEIPIRDELFQIFGWSPDDRFLAFADISEGQYRYKEREPQNEKRVWIYDSINNTVERLTTNSGVVEVGFAWLGTNASYHVGVTPIGKDYTQKFVGDWITRERRQVYNSVSEFTLLPGAEAAFFQNGSIRKCRIDEPRYPAIQSVTTFPDGSFDSMKWLRYSAEVDSFLFCGRPVSSNWKHLFKVDQKTGQTEQLTTCDTYNGQWLENGRGLAYIINDNNSFELALRPSSRFSSTNLFTDGCALNYTVAPDGIRVYITGSLGMEPQGLWEYRLTTGVLTNLVKGWMDGPKKAKWVEPQELRIQSVDGVKVPVFLYAPPDDVKESKKHWPREWPIIFYLPCSTWQAQKAFDIQAQSMANCGFYFAAVNYQGVDGYGRDYASNKGIDLQVRDVLAVRDYLARHFPVDKGNMFLSANSDSCAIAFQLVQRQPKAWRGALLDHPAPVFDQASQFSPLFIVSGDQDPSLPAISAFVKTIQQGPEVQLLVHTNCGHLNWKTREVGAMYAQALEFFLNKLD